MEADEIERLAKVVSHNVGEALLRKYGEFRWPDDLNMVAEYYSLIREEVEQVLVCSS